MILNNPLFVFDKVKWLRQTATTIKLLIFLHISMTLCDIFNLRLNVIKFEELSGDEFLSFTGHKP